MIRSFDGKSPKIATSAFVSETALISGDVEVGEETGIWPGAVLRADFGRIKIGNRTDIEDGCILHTGPLLEIGDNVIIGHGAVIHCRRIGNWVLVGMGAIILEEAEVGNHSIIAAGSVVSEGMIIPPGSFVAGVPAKVKGRVSEEQMRERLERHSAYYIPLGKRYKEQGF